MGIGKLFKISILQGLAEFFRKSSSGFLFSKFQKPLKDVEKEISEWRAFAYVMYTVACGWFLSL